MAAYKEGAFAGPRGAVTAGHIESANFSRNGRNSAGLADGVIGTTAPWIDTYPFAVRSSEYPAEGTQDRKNIGAAFVVPQGVGVDAVEHADGFTLSVAYPNPATDAARLTYALPVGGAETLTLYDLLGRIVAVPLGEVVPAGERTLRLDLGGVPSGVYVYRLRVDGVGERVEKLVVQR